MSLSPFPLSKTYSAGSETFAEVVLREPTFEDYRQLGPAYDVQKGLMLPDRDAIFAYVDRLVQKPAAGALAVLTVEDAMGLEGHILDFFVNARVSLNRRMNSSSASAGTLATSTV